MIDLPRGIRNFNPGNIDKSSEIWQGQATIQTDPRFVTFVDPVHGIRAIMKILLTYNSAYKLNTIKDLIERWAPPTENNTPAYVADVAKHCGIASDMMIPDLSSYLVPLAQAITYHENGAAVAPYPEFWYSNDVYQAAQKMALS